MNVDRVRKQLEIDEGVVYEIYNDHLGYPTFGIGHLIKDTDLAGHRSDFNDYLDRVQNPSMYSTPRLVKFSLGMNF